MNKEAYRAKYEVAVMPVDDDTTVRELKLRKAVENKLRRFWKTEASHWLERNVVNQPLDEWLAGWHDIEFTYNIKPTGSVKVRLLACDDHRPARLLREINIPKSELYIPAKT